MTCARCPTSARFWQIWVFPSPTPQSLVSCFGTDVNPNAGLMGRESLRPCYGALMPCGLVRWQLTNMPHFLTWSCYRRQQYFTAPAMKDLFLDCLESSRRRYRLLVYGYVVMPEHVYLLVSEPSNDLLSTSIQALKISFFRRATAIGLRHSPFWQKRYYDHNVRSAHSFSNKLGYIHRNPVHRGLVRELQDWPWSSYRHYLTGAAEIVEIESEWTAMRRTGRVPHLPKPGRCGAPTCEGWSE